MKLWEDGAIVGEGSVSIPERVLEALKHQYLKLSTALTFAVSIPERVLEALKPYLGISKIGLASVSIPERVLEALKLIRWNKPRERLRFQSLKGF